MEPIRIGKHVIGGDNPCFIIAEISANHNQDFGHAIRLIKLAKESGADAVKFQTYTPDTITLNCNNEHFKIKEGPWKGQTLYELYKQAYTPWEWFPKLKAYADSIGITFFSTAFDTTAVDLLKSIDVPAYKIASFEIVDIRLLRRAAATKKPIILSTGLASHEDVRLAVETIRGQGNDQIVLLKCNSNYPAIADELNIRQIETLRKEFETLVGFSDHSLEVSADIMAVALGVCVIEKHVTANRSVGGPDSVFSLEPKELKALVEAVRSAERSLGNGAFVLSAGERASLQFRRSLFVIKTMPTGARILNGNLRSIRPGIGLKPRHLDALVGKKVNRRMDAGEPIRWKDIDQAAVRLRGAKISDAHTLYSWILDPDSRRFALDTRSFSFAEHCDWLRKRLADPQCRLWIAEYDSEPIGMVRFDGNNKNAAVSVNIDPAWRGQGLGKRLLHLAIRKAEKQRFAKILLAYVHAENGASLKIFKDCGFLESKSDKSGYSLLTRSVTQNRARP
jgi:N-acetylneuraminate synthase